MVTVGTLELKYALMDNSKTQQYDPQSQIALPTHPIEVAFSEKEMLASVEIKRDRPLWPAY